MKLQDATWPEVQAFNRDAVVLIPTGSLEQHGKHLPLFTDSLIVTAIAEAVEANLREEVVLVPTVWLGASGHHLSFPGSLSASFEGYEATLTQVVESLIPHSFTKFFVLNGHGGNTEPNGVALRRLKALHPNVTFGHAGYYGYVAKQIESVLEGPLKDIAHACEAETSLMLHLHPALVRKEALRNDGLKPAPPIQGLIHNFDQMTEDGSFGYAPLATADKGKRIFEAAVAEITKRMGELAAGYVLIGLDAASE